MAPPQSGYTLEQDIIHMQTGRTWQVYELELEGSRNTFPPWLATAPTLHHVERLWRRVLLDEFPAVRHRASLWGTQGWGWGLSALQHLALCFQKEQGSRKCPSLLAPCVLDYHPSESQMVSLKIGQKEFSGPKCTLASTVHARGTQGDMIQVVV